MWRDLAQPSHLLILALLLGLLFGWKKLPDMARSLGRSMRIFKSEVSEMKNDGASAKPSPAASDTVPGGVVPPTAPAPGPAPASSSAPGPAAAAPAPAPAPAAAAPGVTSPTDDASPR